MSKVSADVERRMRSGIRREQRKASLWHEKRAEKVRKVNADVDRRVRAWPEASLGPDPRAIAAGDAYASTVVRSWPC